MSSPVSKRGAWAPDPVIDAPTPSAAPMAALPPNQRPAYAVTPWPSQHARGVRVAPAENALNEFTGQDARALGVRDVISLDADGSSVTETPGCMPLPSR
jgi:hypothetical protein